LGAYSSYSVGIHLTVKLYFCALVYFIILFGYKATIAYGCDILYICFHGLQHRCV